MYKIITTPSDILTAVAKPVEKFDRKLKKIITEMEETLIHTEDPIGVGLAAPQVSISQRIFLARPTEKSKIIHFINPILEIKDQRSTKRKKGNNVDDDNKILEGCLSIPNIWGHVTRPQKVTVTYQDWDGKKFTDTYEDFMAIIIQHEVDHLNGILFTSHSLSQGEKLYRSYKTSKGEEEFEEVGI